jgi:hypothetical protein
VSEFYGNSKDKANNINVTKRLVSSFESYFKAQKRATGKSEHG